MCNLYQLISMEMKYLMRENVAAWQWRLRRLLVKSALKADSACQ
jgi:hypothetical protein